MKLTKAPCKIVGLRVGEISSNLLISDGSLTAKFALLRDPEKSDGINSGSYTKEGGWSSRTLEAFQELVNCLEEDALRDVFSVDPSGDQGLEESEDSGLAFPDVPTLGGARSGTPQI